MASHTTPFSSAFGNLLCIVCLIFVARAELNVVETQQHHSQSAVSPTVPAPTTKTATSYAIEESRHIVVSIRSAIAWICTLLVFRVTRLPVEACFNVGGDDPDRKVLTSPTLWLVLLRRCLLGGSSSDLSCGSLTRFYSESSRYWVLTNETLEFVNNDVQLILDCAVDGDTLLFQTNEVIRPRRTLVVSKNITLGSFSEAEFTQNGSLIHSVQKARFTCPESGPLIVSRSSNFTLFNVAIFNCNSTSNMIELKPDCSNERTLGIVRFVQIIITRNELFGRARIVDSRTPLCFQLELDVVTIRWNNCSTASCVLLSSRNTLTNVQLRFNRHMSESLDASIFQTPNVSSRTIAINVRSRGNQIRSFIVSRGTLNLTDSYFNNNTKSRSAGTRDGAIGGGVLFSNHSIVFIIRTNFERNVAFNGGGIFALASNISVHDCEFQENDARDGNGGALYGQYNSSFDISSSEFSRNRGYRGAALFFNYTMQLSIVNSRIWGNNCSRSCSIYISNTIASIASCEFLKNNGVVSGAALCASKANLTLENSTFVGNNASSGGACIFELNSQVSGDSLHFENNTAHENHGGSIYLASESRLELINSTFRRNIAQSYGGVVYASTRSRLLLSKSYFSRNEATFGGAIFEDNSVNGSLSNCNFTNNTALTSGGAIYLQRASKLSLLFVRLYNNEAMSSAAVFLAGSSNGTVSHCSFVNNIVQNYGGVFYLIERSSVTLSDSNFSSNRALFGGALLLRSSRATISNCNFTNHETTTHGGVLHLVKASLIFLSHTRMHNNVGESGGALFLENVCNATVLNCSFTQNRARKFGGAISIYGNSTLILINSIFASNRALFGAALVLEDFSNGTVSYCNFTNNVASKDGGAIFARQNCNLTLLESHASRNQASGGGVINLIFSCNGIVKYCNFSNNLAEANAGAIWIQKSSTLSLSNSTLERNEALNGGSIRMQESSNLTSTNTNFINNKATSSGGVISVLINSTLSLAKCLFSGNLANDLGGAIHLNNCSISLVDVTINSNNAAFGGAMYAFNASIEVMHSMLEINRASKSGGAIYMNQSNATIDNTLVQENNAQEDCGGICIVELSLLDASNLSVQSNFVENVGGGIGIRDASSILCYSCIISNNRALRGAGMHVYSNNSISIAAQVQNSRFENNHAETYGGGIAFATLTSRNINCNSSNVTCSRVILLSTTFVDNYAKYSGAAILAPHANGVLIDCEYKQKRKQGFLNQQNFKAFESLDPRQLCPKWIGNKLLTDKSGDIVGTYGQLIELSIDAHDEVRLIGSSRIGYILDNVSSGRQLPTINVILLDAYGVGPAPTVPYSFEARLSSPDGFFSGLYPANISAGAGNFSNIAGFAKPKNYTIKIEFDNLSLETFNVIVRVRECHIDEEPTEEGLICQVCDELSYNFDPSKPNGCEECPTDATCREKYIVPNEHHWHKSPCHDTIQECLIEKACSYENRNNALTNFTNNFTNCDFNETELETYNDELCNEGYEGLLCGSCKTSYGLSATFQCLKCPTVLVSVLIILGITLYLLGTAAITIRGCLPFHSKSKEDPSGSDQSSSVIGPLTRDSQISIEMVHAMVEDNVSRGQLVGQQGTSTVHTQTSNMSLVQAVKIEEVDEYELTKWQMTEVFKTTAVAATLGVQWTDGILTLFESSEYIGAVTTVALSRPVDCISTSDSALSRAIWRMLISIFVPLIVMCIFFLFWCINAVKKRRGWGYFWKRCTLSIISVTYISYLGLTKMAVRVFYCVDVYDSQDYSSPSKHKVLAVDTAIRCYGGDHFSIIAIAVLILVFVSICFPLYSSIVLLKHKDSLRDRDSWIFETAGFMFRAFKEKFAFWESVVMSRKAFLSVIVVFSYPLGGDSQGLLGSLLLFLCLYMHLTLSPYRDEFKTLNHLESASLVVSGSTFNLGVFFATGRCSDSIRILLSLIIIFGNVMFCLCLFLAFFYACIVHLKVVLQYENIPLPDPPTWWKVLKIYISSRLAKCCQ